MLSKLAVLAAAAVSAITAPGPEGPLAGTLLSAGDEAPVVLIIPGSGPTDRDGNNPLGVKAAPYRMLAEALAEQGVSSVRIDKRGLFESKAAVADPNAVTIADYAKDTHAWVEAIRERTGAGCVWLLGHSEGGLIALSAAQSPDGICGIILVSTAGRKMGDVMREQLRANPANAPVLDDALAAIDSLEAGKPVDVSGFHPALQMLFAPPVQPYLIDLMSADPAALVLRTALPVLIVQGGEDLQVTAEDARLLAAAQPMARLETINAMNHVLKEVASGDRAANLAAYSDPSLPVSEALTGAIADFVKPPPVAGSD